MSFGYNRSKYDRKNSMPKTVGRSEEYKANKLYYMGTAMLFEEKPHVVNYLR